MLECKGTDSKGRVHAQIRIDSITRALEMHQELNRCMQRKELVPYDKGHLRLVEVRLISVYRTHGVQYHLVMAIGHRTEEL